MTSQRQSHYPHLFCLDFSEVTDKESCVLTKGAVRGEISRTPI